MLNWFIGLSPVKRSPLKGPLQRDHDVCQVLCSVYFGLIKSFQKQIDCDGGDGQGPRGFIKLHEACTINFNLSWYLSNFMFQTDGQTAFWLEYFFSVYGR